ncbi:hypothetical protein BH10ACI3_BH10ACI3_16990 [soil metagenome]
MTKVQVIRKLQDSFMLHFGVLFAAIIVFFAKKPPFENEYIYLLRLAKTYRSDFLLNDLSFSVPANEHWLFNHLFGLLTFIFSIEVISWGGRIFCWTVLLFAVMRLARHWEIPLWMSSVSILLWLARGQAVIGHEWIFGSFEAKCVAYICLLLAIDGLVREKAAYPGVLLGLTFSFHPAVGLWGILAAGIALVFCRWEMRKILTVVALTFVFALPGIAALFTEVSTPASVEDWKFVELARYPHIFDPFVFSKSGVCLVYLELLFCLLFFWSRGRDKRREFLPFFLATLGVFFTAGFVLRGFEQFPLLRFMPMRLFPVFVTLFFLFTFAAAFQRKLFTPPLTALAAVGFACLIFFQSPLTTAADQAVQNYRSWTTELDDTAKSFVWLRDNTPNGTTVIAPPWRQDFWYLAQRAQVASASFPTYFDLGEWRRRVETLSGETLSNMLDRDNDQRPAFYRALPTETINEVARNSNAEYLVSDGEYPYPVVFRSGDVKVYQLTH